jgi:glycerophosphoryl diester phosphodiesterase
LLTLLDRYGYRGKRAPVFIQSFEVGNLKALRAKTDLPLIQLLALEGGPADAPDMRYADMTSSAALKAIAAYADGIGPDKNMVMARNALEFLSAPTSLVADAHTAGLKVHPWTFRRENAFLPTNFKSGLDDASAGDIDAEIRTYLALGIDGLFTDNTPEVARAMKRNTAAGE